MDVMYVANEGFLLRAFNKKILIDSLFGGFESTWCDVPPPDVVHQMEKATSPFDRVDLVLISHAHADHFNSEIVSRHLHSNGGAILICPYQVAEQLRAEAGHEELAPRVIEVTPEDGVNVRIDVKGVRIEVWRLPHSPYYVESDKGHHRQNKHENVQNLGFTIEIDDGRIFHGGDWEWDGTEDKKTPLDEEKIDLAFLSVGTYLSLYTHESNAIRAHRKPRNTVLMHLPPAGNLEALTGEEKKAVSATTVFKSSMEIRHFAD